MTRAMYGTGILAMILSAVPLVLCGIQGRQGPSEQDWAAASSLFEWSSMQGTPEGENKQEVASPLVAQATAFALYLNPAEPPETGPPSVVRRPPAPRPVVVTPKFRLLLTSCHRSRPEKSLALIFEPGRGDRWVKKGDRMGYLVVEQIKDGTLVCRDGARLQEVSVARKPSVELARLASDPATVTRGDRSKVQLLNAARTGPAGLDTPEARTAAYQEE